MQIRTKPDYHRANYYAVSLMEDIGVDQYIRFLNNGTAQDFVSKSIEIKSYQSLDIEVPTHLHNDNLPIHASTCFNNSKTFILYNNKTTQEIINFSILHEIGHLLLNHDKEDGIIDKDILEKEANAFAVHFLCPYFLLSDMYLHLFIDEYHLANVIERYFTVSTPAAEYRVKFLKKHGPHASWVYTPNYDFQIEVINRTEKDILKIFNQTNSAVEDSPYSTKQERESIKSDKDASSIFYSYLALQRFNKYLENNSQPLVECYV